jgi:glycoside/pentoside/hexuronide:cation symporter, GPH family
MNGLIFSACMFAQKFGLTIGAGLAGWLLGWFGYVANVPQSDEALTGIRLLFTFIPAAFALLNVLVLTRYRLSDIEVARIESELHERRLAYATQ